MSNAKFNYCSDDLNYMERTLIKSFLYLPMIAKTTSSLLGTEFDNSSQNLTAVYCSNDRSGIKLAFKRHLKLIS